jgi:hypothetical protein
MVIYDLCPDTQFLKGAKVFNKLQETSEVYFFATGKFFRWKRLSDEKKTLGSFSAGSGLIKERLPKRRERTGLKDKKWK